MCTYIKVTRYQVLKTIIITKTHFRNNLSLLSTNKGAGKTPKHMFHYNEINDQGNKNNVN